MDKKVSFSGENLSLKEAADFHRDAEAALKQYYSVLSPTFALRFVSSKTQDVDAELAERLAELDKSSAMNVLASLEARFRIDYEIRRTRKKKDPISIDFRGLYTRKGSRVSLEDDILEVWRNHQPDDKALVGALRGAFKFRHWMAHGRYWTPKFGKRIDYLAAFALVQLTLASFPLLSTE